MKKQVFNPYLPTYEYVPDGEPHVFGDRVYVYGSHDRAHGTDYCLNDYICWSAPIEDLSDWRYEGVIFKKVQEPLYNGKNICNLYAPDVCCGPDGRYYLYYSMENSEVISVAVCDTPAGEYQFLGHVHDENGYEWGSKEGDLIEFDPAVLVDDDGRIYLYSGFNPFFPFKPTRTYDGAHCYELKSDMITTCSHSKNIMPKFDELLTSHNFFEASSIRKVGDTYYFVYSSQQCVELCYATSKYPDRDFVFRGTIVSNVDIGVDGNKIPRNHGGNNHGGMVKINDQWYIFYHRPTNMTMFSRQGSAEPITIAEDGSIKQVEMTSCGLNGAPLTGKGIYTAGIVCNIFPKNISEMEINHAMELREIEEQMAYITQDGEDREEEPGTYITRITDGTLLGYKYFAVKDLSAVRIKVRGNGIGKILVKTDFGADVIAEIAVDFSVKSDCKMWESFQSEVSYPITAGVYPLYFEYVGEGSIDFMEFELV